MPIGGETLSSGWGSEHRNSDAMTSRVVDEMYEPEGTPVTLMLSQRSSSPNRGAEEFKWPSGIAIHLGPIDGKSADIRN